MAPWQNTTQTNLAIPQQFKLFNSRDHNQSKCNTSSKRESKPTKSPFTGQWKIPQPRRGRELSMRPRGPNLHLMESCELHRDGLNDQHVATHKGHRKCHIGPHTHMNPWATTWQSIFTLLANLGCPTTPTTDLPTQCHRPIQLRGGTKPR